MSSMPVEQIRIEDRHRHDLGDLSGLIESIRSVGLLHPVVVTTDGRLVAGERRLAACGNLGWTDVPVTVIGSLSEARKLLEAERDENTCRLDMRPSEKVALGRALEELERPHREANRTANLPGQPKPENFRFGETAEIVGEAVGMSRPTYNRAKAVVEEAENGNPVAVEAVAEMDRTGKVTPAYEKVIGRPTDGRKIAELRDVPRQPNPIKQRHMPAANQIVPRVLSALRVQAKELDRAITDGTLNTEEAADWSRDLSDVLRSLRASNNRLKGV